MEKVLKLYKLKDGGWETFPPSDEQIITSDFTYTAKRMGGAPSISCSIYHPSPLDDVFDESVYTEFNGEKFYLHRRPSATKSNGDVRYKYDLEFVSERVALDNVFFFDVVADKTYKGATRSTTFSFSGDIHQFATRMNYSLEMSHLDYRVYVDDGITSEDKHMSFDGQYFSEVLQEVYNAYNLPYYFKGKEIHIGPYDEEKQLTTVLEYGANNSLLSISKTNANHMVVNRITGVGSSDNLPYYYPNETPLGKVDVRAIETNAKLADDDCFKIVSPEKLKLVGLNEEVRFGKYEKDDFDGTPITSYITKETLSGKDITIPFSLGWKGTNEDYIKCAHPYSVDFIVPRSYTYHYHLIVTFTTEQQQGGVLRCYWKPNPNYMNLYDQVKTYGYFHFKLWDNLKVSQRYGDSLVKTDAHFVGDMDGYLNITFVGQHDYPVELHIEFDFQKDLVNGTQVGGSDVGLFTFTNIELMSTDIDKPYYWSTSKRTSTNLTDFGIGLTAKGYTIFNADKDAIVGDGCYLAQSEKDGYITPQPNLMPPIYRENFFTDKDPYFYNAVNDTYYINPNDTKEGKYEFPNPFVEGRPQEYIQNFDDIRPSIKGLLDSEGNAIDQFIDFAYDDGDNDGIDDNGELLHPYFYAKLPRFTQDNEFNLFDHAIESGEMTISMTSGNCGACSFKIAVDKESGKNTLQVDSNGNLLRDAKGNVVFGAPQDRQNDTINNNVWIALHKDVDTFPSLMPNNGDRNKPKANTVNTKETTDTKVVMNNDGDTFVILNIDLPQAYIFAAEKRLEQELIKFMHSNNEDKFNFSVKMSRIYLAENPDVLREVNENSSVEVRYNNVVYPLYVSSFSYKMKEGDLLPEISIELADTLTITPNAIQQAVGDVKAQLLSAIDANSTVRQLNKFLRKDIDDTSLGCPTFERGLKSNSDANFGNFVENTRGAGIFSDANGNWHMETDYVRVRKKLSATTVEVEEAHHVGGTQMLTAASAVIDFVIEKDNVYRCFFRKDDPQGNSITNKWKVGDQAYCKFFNIESAGEVSNRYYWRTVTATSLTTSEETQTFTIDGEVVMTSNYHFVDLSKNECSGEGDDAPLALDHIVQLGYRNDDDPSRQNAIIMAGAGEGSPYIQQFVGINSFTLPEPETQIKPNENILSGTTRFKGVGGKEKNLQDVGSTLDETKKQVENLEVGVNLLRNTGFVGDYESISLNNQQNLDGNTNMFSPSLVYWVAENTTIQEYADSRSGYCAYMKSMAKLSQKLFFKTESDSNYILTFKARVDSKYSSSTLIIRVGGVQQNVTITADVLEYKVKLTPTLNTEVFSLTTILPIRLYELSLIKGTIPPSTWEASPLDNRKEQASYESLSYLKNLLQVPTIIDGGQIATGVVNTGLINMGHFDEEGNLERITAGMSGTYNNDDSVAFFGGGDLAQAIYTVQKYKANPNYEPTTDELANMSKVVITHGGRAILEDVIIRGYVYADGGRFRGTVEATDGTFNGKVTANEGRIGSLKITEHGLSDDNNATFSLTPDYIRVGRRETYAEHPAGASFCSGMGFDARPSLALYESVDDEVYKYVAMFARSSNAATVGRVLSPAFEAISDNGVSGVSIFAHGVAIHNTGALNRTHLMVIDAESSTNRLSLWSGNHFVVQATYKNANGATDIYLPSVSELRSLFRRQYAITEITITNHLWSTAPIHVWFLKNVDEQNSRIYTKLGGATDNWIASKGVSVPVGSSITLSLHDGVNFAYAHLPYTGARYDIGVLNIIT